MMETKEEDNGRRCRKKNKEVDDGDAERKIKRLIREKPKEKEKWMTQTQKERERLMTKTKGGR